MNPVATASTEVIRDIDPATGELIAELLITTPEQVAAAVGTAREALGAWSARSIADRVSVLERVAKRCEDEAWIEQAAMLITREMGKPISNARREAAACAPGIRRLARSCADALAPIETREGNTCTRLSREALGVVAAITPWNFPLGMAREVIVPALVAGNTVVFKPSEITPLSGACLHEAFAAELPAGVMPLVQGLEQTGKALVAGDIDMVGFVGSVAAGRHIMAACAPSLKRIVLELGGKDPMIVCDGADLPAAARHAVSESMRNTGQVCCSIERIYVERNVAEEFTRLVCEEAGKITAGDGREDVFMGPMASEAQRDNVLRQIEDARARGARVLAGGSAGDGPGWFLPPTVVADVDESMLLLTEETFGPVATLRTVESADEAVRLANASEFGLGASVWAADNEQGVALAARLESGQVGVNRGLGAAGDPPWCGVKQSGFGFLGSPDGHRQFSRPLTISWNIDE